MSKILKRNSIYVNMKDKDPFAKDNDAIEVSQWYNGEGYDISTIHGNNVNILSLTISEFGQIRKAIKKLDTTAL
jgi:hypothetical protein